MSNSQLKNSNQGDISFSVPKWKQHELKQIKFSQQKQFYSSTPYNLNDFKSQNRSQNTQFFSLLVKENSIIDLNNQLLNQFNIVKQLKNNKNISTAIFVSYLYEFTSRTMNFIQKNITQAQKLNSNSKTVKNNIKAQQQKVDNEIQIKSQMLKQLKIKIYGIDLCLVKQIPPKFTSFYNNDILKKIIFQYLTKCMLNVSLIQILLEGNQFLVFALSLISKSLLAQHFIIAKYNQQTSFLEQVQTFLSCFDKIPTDSENITSKILPSQIIEQTNQRTKKSKHQNQSKQYMMFSSSKNQMKSISTLLKLQTAQFSSQNDIKICLYRKQNQQSHQILEKQKLNQQKQVQLAINRQKSSIKEKKKGESQKMVMLKNEQRQKGCLESLSCWKFFS